MAKVHSLTFVIIVFFVLSLGVVISVESINQIAGIIGVLSALFFAFMTYRKKLLNAGFTAFSNQYRVEMDEFKNEVFRYVDDMRKLMNKNEDGHTKTLKQIVTLNLETQKQVTEQIGACKLIQGRKDILTKTDQGWKSKIDKKTADILKDVEEMKASIAYIQGKLNGKK